MVSPTRKLLFGCSRKNLFVRVNASFGLRDSGVEGRLSGPSPRKYPLILVSECIIQEESAGERGHHVYGLATIGQVIASRSGKFPDGDFGGVRGCSSTGRPLYDLVAPTGREGDLVQSARIRYSPMTSQAKSGLGPQLSRQHRLPTYRARGEVSVRFGIGCQRVLTETEWLNCRIGKRVYRIRLRTYVVGVGWAGKRSPIPSASFQAIAPKTDRE